MDCFVARAPRNDVERPVPYSTFAAPASADLIFVLSTSLRAQRSNPSRNTTSATDGLLRRCAPRNDAERTVPYSTFAAPASADLTVALSTSLRAQRSNPSRSTTSATDGLLRRCAPRNDAERTVP